MNFLHRNIQAIALTAPLVVYFIIGALIPLQDSASAGIDSGRLLIVVIARVLAIGAVLACFWKIYVADFPLRSDRGDVPVSTVSRGGVDRWGWIVGLVGGVLWIAICALDAERVIIKSIGFSETVLGSRSAVNPFEAYPEESLRWLFLVFRFTLLVLVVPIAEELFLRGFFMRVVDSDQWSTQPLSQIGRAGLISGTLYGVIAHPGEFLAAACWFSLITWLMIRTGKFWNCVLAHAITNWMLGLYICWTGSWRLW